MSQKPEKTKHETVKKKLGISLPNNNTSMVIRLVVASVIFAFSLIVSMPEFLSIILLVLSAAAAGYDIVLQAMNSIEEGDYFAVPVVVVFITLLAYFIGFAIEGAALVLLYQIGLMLINYADEHTRKSALDLLSYQDDGIKSKMAELINNKEATSMSIESVMKNSASSVLKLAMIFAVIYAIALPIFTNYTFTVSIHRALTIILIATPMSVTVSIPLAAVVGMCYSAQQGVVTENASTIEALADSTVAVFDKGGIFAEECPRIIAMYSDVLDSSTFMNFVAHSVYYSNQPIAKAISAAFDQDYKLEVIGNFRDVPGYGMELTIDNIPVSFGTKKLYAGREVELPEDNAALGQSYYMVVANKYVGKVVISSDVNENTANLIPEMKAVGFNRCILLTEDSKEVGQQFAELMNFNEMYSQCDTEKKLSIIGDIAKREKGAVVFIYSSGVEAHSAAAVDIRVGTKGKFADAIVTPAFVNNLPFAKQVAVRVKEVAIENALFAFIVKAILVFLSIIGYCNLWFAIFIDMVAAVVTILNTIRVTNESMLNSLRYKMGR
jgi:Cd2+/Zn2+-exporting ATPase